MLERCYSQPPKHPMFSSANGGTQRSKTYRGQCEFEYIQVRATLVYVCGLEYILSLQWVRIRCFQQLIPILGPPFCANTSGDQHKCGMVRKL